MFTVVSAIAAIMVYGSAAYACISCEYVPPVVNSGTTTHQKQRMVRERRHVVKREGRSGASKKLSTRQPTAPKEAATVEATPKGPPQTEQSDIATAGDAPVGARAAEVAPEPTESQNENSAITQAAKSGSGAAKPIEQAKADKSGTCKKFFPSAGLTLSVPCE
jgi:hypothetical protein